MTTEELIDRLKRFPTAEIYVEDNSGELYNIDRLIYDTEDNEITIRLVQ